MKSGFKDPTAPKKVEPNYKPRDGKNTPWEDRKPKYDERSSCFVNLGQHYGVGHRQPVGSEKHTTSGGVPVGHVATMRVDEAG